MMHEQKHIQKIRSKELKSPKTPKFLWFENFEKFDVNAWMHVI